MDDGEFTETLAYLAFPSEHWRRIRTNNPLERTMREIRRRTRVVRRIPRRRECAEPRSRQAAARRRLALVDSALSEMRSC
jgi:transposase-like protein